MDKLRKIFKKKKNKPRPEISPPIPIRTTSLSSRSPPMPRHPPPSPPRYSATPISSRRLLNQKGGKYSIRKKRRTYKKKKISRKIKKTKKCRKI